MSNKRSQNETLEKSYKNLLRLINRAENLDAPIEREEPYHYIDLFDDEDFLEDLILEIDHSVSRLVMQLHVQPYVFYDAFEIKNNHLNEIKENGWNETFADILKESDGTIPDNRKVLEKAGILKPLFEKDKASNFLKVYNSEGYSDLLKIKEYLKKELTLVNEVMYTNALLVLKKLADIDTKTKIQFFQRLFRGVFGHTPLFFGAKYMYKLDFDIIDLPSSTYSLINHDRLDFLNKNRRHGAELNYKIELINHITIEKKQGRKSDDIESFYKNYIETHVQQRITDGRGLHNKPDKIMPEARFWKEASDYANEVDEPLTKDGNPKDELIKSLVEGKYQIDEERRKLVGYKRKDEEKDNPQELTYITVRRRLNNYKDKWLY